MSRFETGQKKQESAFFSPPHRQELLKRYGPEAGTGTQNFHLAVPVIQLHQKFATASARKTGFAIRHQADQFVDRLLPRRNHGSQRIALRAHPKRAGAVDAAPRINTPPTVINAATTPPASRNGETVLGRRFASAAAIRNSQSGRVSVRKIRTLPPPDPQSPEFHGTRRFPAGFPLRPDRQDVGIRDAPPLSSNERSGSFCVPSLPIPPRPGRRGRPRPARRTEQTFRTIPPLRPDFPPHPAEDATAEEDFPLSETLPDALPEKHSPLRTGFRREKRIKTLPFSRILPQRCYFQHRSLHTPRRSLRLSVAFRKQYIRTEEQNQEKKKARPDRTGSGKLTSLRRFLCLCKRWNRLFSLLWRESDWSCSG